MIKIAFFNNKGGVGKSSAVINIAHAMTRLNKSVLVVDCDDQKNTFRFFSDEQESDYSGDTRYKNLDIELLIDRTNPYASSANLGIYNYELLDLPPSLDERTRKIISDCDFVFVPIELGTFAIQGIANVTEAIAATGARFGGCFVSKFDRKNPADHELDELLRQTLGNKVMAAKIPYSRVIKNSISYRQTAFEYMEWTSAADAYVSLTTEIIAICEGGNDNG